MSVGARSAWIRTAFLVLLLSGMRMPHAAAGVDDERAFLSLWTVPQSAPDDHAAVLAACQAFGPAHPSSPFGGVADTLAAWRLLKLGRTPEAVTLLETLQRRPQEAVAQGAYEMAQAWLTRIDRARVQQALQFYYRREIGYPALLSELSDYPALPAAMAFPAADRWGLRWDYRLAGFHHLTGLLNQKYALQSRKLGPGSDLKEALALAYGAQILVRVVSVRSSTPGQEIVEMEIASPAATGAAETSPRPRSVFVGVNSWTEGVFLAYVGRQFILVCDRMHWKVFSTPGTRG